MAVIAAARAPLGGAGDPLPPPWSDPGDGQRRLVWVGKTTPMKGWDRLEQLARDLADELGGIQMGASDGFDARAETSLQQLRGLAIVQA